MTLADYLGSEQAREDVRILLELSVGYFRVGHGTWNLGIDSAWKTAIYHENASGNDYAAYYRPDGDRFVVTDLGEGVRALRLRTGCSQYLAMERSDPMREDLRVCGIGSVWSTERGIMELDNVTAADLPDALCRVMLASLRVSEVQP